MSINKTYLMTAEDNPWYLLATLYGVPRRHETTLRERNREVWNRYFAAQWKDLDQQRLKDRVKLIEISPFDETELLQVRESFLKRANNQSIKIPNPEENQNFGACHFERITDFSGYIFLNTSFGGATFSMYADFRDSVFIGDAIFNNTTFLGSAYFRSSFFSGSAFFSNSKFTGAIDFSKTIVLINSNFKSSSINGYANFNNIDFSGDANFNNIEFSTDANFYKAFISGNMNFANSVIYGAATFTYAKFSKAADFSGTSIDGDATFQKVIVNGDANFSGTKFSSVANFARLAVSGGIKFCNATFNGDAQFRNAVFSDDAYFSAATYNGRAIFTDTELKAPTDFAECRFEKFPPQFLGAKLHEGTVWRGVSWPKPPSNPNDVGHFTDAYERLKLEMDRLKKHEDELMFFAKELECRRVAAGQFRGLPIGSYGVLSLYGQSYLRPLGWLLALILIGAVQFWPVLKWDSMLSLGVSTANVLGPLGLRKELVDPEALNGLSRWFQVLTGAQMVLGPVLLFLIGLGLRNRFRMK